MSDPIQSINDLARTSTLAVEAMKIAGEELRLRERQIEIALNALLLIVEGRGDARNIAGGAVLAMRKLNMESGPTR